MEAKRKPRAIVNKATSETRPVRALGRASNTGLLFLVLAVPLAYLPFSADSFVLPKITLLYVGAALLGAVGLALYLLQPERRPAPWVLFLPVAIFTLWAGLATIASVDPLQSFWGHYQRYYGLATYLAFLALFLVGYQTFRRRDGGTRVFAGLTAAAALISIVGVLQYLGVIPYPFEDKAFETYRSFASYGNPNFLASFLAFCLPIAIATALRPPWPGTGPLFGLAVLLIFASLITTFTRGGWLAGLVGLAILTGLLWRGRDKSRSLDGNSPGFRRYRLLLVAGVLALLVLLGLVLFSARTQGSGADLLARIGSIANPGEGTAATRVELWGISWRMAADRPIFGWGPETYNLVFPQFQTLRDIRLAGANRIADSAHNTPLNLAATMGFPGAALYLAMFGLFLWAGFVLARQARAPAGKTELENHAGGPNYLFAGITAALGASFVASLFTVDLSAVSFLNWIAFAAIAAGFSRSEQPELEAANRSQDRSRSVNRSVRSRGLGEVTPAFLFLAPIALALGLILAFLAIRPLVADIHYLSGKQLRRAAPNDSAAQKFLQAISWNPSNDVYRRSLAELYFARAISLGDPSIGGQAIRILEDTVALHPRETNTHRYLVEVGHGLGALDPRYYQRALEWAEEGVRLQPKSAKLQFLVGSLYLELQKPEQALKPLLTSTALHPADARTLAALGVAYERLGRKEQAIRTYKKALTVAPGWLPLLQALDRLETKT